MQSFDQEYNSLKLQNQHIPIFCNDDDTKSENKTKFENVNKQNQIRSNKGSSKISQLNSFYVTSENQVQTKPTVFLYGSYHQTNACFSPINSFLSQNSADPHSSVSESSIQTGDVQPDLKESTFIENNDDSCDSKNIADNVEDCCNYINNKYPNETLDLNQSSELHIPFQDDSQSTINADINKINSGRPSYTEQRNSETDQIQGSSFINGSSNFVSSTSPLVSSSASSLITVEGMKESHNSNLHQNSLQCNYIEKQASPKQQKLQSDGRCQIRQQELSDAYKSRIKQLFLGKYYPQELNKIYDQIIFKQQELQSEESCNTSELIISENYKSQIYNAFLGQHYQQELLEIKGENQIHIPIFDEQCSEYRSICNRICTELKEHLQDKSKRYQNHLIKVIAKAFHYKQFTNNKIEEVASYLNKKNSTKFVKFMISLVKQNSLKSRFKIRGIVERNPNVINCLQRLYKKVIARVTKYELRKKS